MRLTRHGLVVWLPVSIAVLIGGWYAAAAQSWPLLTAAFGTWLLVAAFFRDPSRRTPPDLSPGDMLSPADGTVTAVEEVNHHEVAGGPALVLRIFLSVLDVHVNRSPSDVTVLDRLHVPGRFLDARSVDAASCNESTLLVLETSCGTRIGVRQIAGKIARRIVCPVKEGDRLARGQQYGMIRFGSGMELILPRPETLSIHVQVGEKVHAGLTILATMPPADRTGQDADDQAH